jgi:hypothetical protein
MMDAMQPTGTFQVIPLYRQVEIRDTDAVARPEWGSEAQPAVASDQCVLLATRSELDGPVQVDVWVGTQGPADPVGRLVFDGELLTTGNGIMVGNSLGEQLYRMALPIGWHPVRVYADPEDAPARFAVLLDGERARAMS